MRSLMSRTAVAAGAAVMLLGPVVGLVGIAGPAQAAFPGANGGIVFDTAFSHRPHIFTIRPDGTSLRQLTHVPKGNAAGSPQDASLASAPVGTGPAFAAENYRTHTLYVPNSGDGTVSVVNLTACSALNVSGCAHKSPVIRVGHIPLGIAVDQATNTV